MNENTEGGSVIAVLPNLLPCLLGEGALTLWLLAVGVNASKWELQAGLGDLQLEPARGAGG